jgi:hypothetical protein
MIYLVDMLRRTGWLQKVTIAVPQTERWVSQIDWQNVSYDQFIRLKKKVEGMPDKISIVEFRRRLGPSCSYKELESLRDGAYLMRELYNLTRRQKRKRRATK